MKKDFKIEGENIKPLINSRGGCIATDKITVEGESVGFMYRVEPSFKNDSGWRLFSGTESQEYVDDSNNSEIYALNTIANYDTSIIPYLDMQIGVELEKKPNSNKFIEVK